MFGTIRKHQTWLWAVIIFATIVSFVIFFTPTSGKGGRGVPEGSFGSLDGRPITRQMYLKCYSEVMLGFLMRYGTWPDGSEAKKFGVSLKNETYSRLALIHEFDSMGIKVEESAVAQWINDRLSDPKQPGSGKLVYERLVSLELPKRGLYEADFQRYARHEVALMHLAAVAGTLGKLVPPREALTAFKQERESVDASAALFSTSNYLASVKIDPAALAQFFTNRMSVYRTPERMQVNYVRFASSNFTAQADELLAKNTNLTAIIDQEYGQRGANFYTDRNGQTMTPEAAKAKIRAEKTTIVALSLARKQAAAFASKVLDVKNANLETLGTMAAASNFVVQASEPFSMDQALRVFRAARDPEKVLAQLNPTAPLAEQLIVGEDSVWVVGLKEKYPSEVPALDNVRQRVVEDFRLDQARQASRQAGTNFAAKVTAGLAQGKAFEAICSEAGVVPLNIPKFSNNTRTVPEMDKRLDLFQVRASASRLQPGKASEFIMSRDGGFVLFLKARQPVGEDEVKKEFPGYLAQLRQSRSYEVFDEWFSHRVEAIKLDAPRERDELE